MVVHHAGHVTVEFDTEVRMIRSRIFIGSLETVIWHLIGLDSNVDIGAIILTSDAKLTSECARIALSVELRAGAFWAHHLSSARHLSTLVRVQVNWSGQRITGVVEQGGHGLAVLEGSSNAGRCSGGA